MSLDPLNSWNYEVLGSSLGELGRLADAEVAYRRALELNPTATDLHVWLAVLLLARHQPAAALEEIDREPNLKARDRVRPFALDAVGRTKEADEAIHHFELTRAADEPEAMGEFYACRHDADRAMPWLERAVTKAIELMDDPLFLRECLSKIASDPRYKALQRKAKLPD